MRANEGERTRGLLERDMRGSKMGRHALSERGIRRPGSREKGFFYRYPDSGETVREEKVLKRIENLKVPPGWEEVRIARGPSAKVQVVGYDAAGRLQYLYHPNYRERTSRRSSTARRCWPA